MIVFEVNNLLLVLCVIVFFNCTLLFENLNKIKNRKKNVKTKKYFCYFLYFLFSFFFEFSRKLHFLIRITFQLGSHVIIEFSSIHSYLGLKNNFSHFFAIYLFIFTTMKKKNSQYLLTFLIQFPLTEGQA